MVSERKEQLRVAWLLPSMARGFYWHPVLSEFTKVYPKSIVYTGVWPGFLPGFNNSFHLKVVGKTKSITFPRKDLSYEVGINMPSLTIMLHLLFFRPQIIFTSGFTLWSMLSLVLKPLLGYRVVIIYDGSSINVDMAHSKFRLRIRRSMTRCADVLITNSQGGSNYLIGVLNAKTTLVFARPYEVPFVAAMSSQAEHREPSLGNLPRPVFLVISRLIKIKGLHLLLQACWLLRKWGCQGYSLIVLGEGPQRAELEQLAVELGLQNNVRWAGWVDYFRLSVYFKRADVLIFPTLMDPWGMVVLEAMAFEKAILCSKWAGAAEMVLDGDNGYVFDPHSPEKLAELMQKFTDDPKLAMAMGARSKKLIESHTPSAAAQFLDGIVGICLQRSKAGTEQDSQH